MMSVLFLWTDSESPGVSVVFIFTGKIHYKVNLQVCLTPDTNTLTQLPSIQEM